MKKLFLIPLVVIFVVGLLFGGSGGEARAPAPAPAKPFKWPASLITQANSARGIAQVVSSSWGPKMEKSTGMKVRLTLEQSESLRAINLKTDRVDLAMHTMTGANLCITAQDAYATRDGGPYQTRIVWLQDFREWSVFVPGDSPLQRISDIRPGLKWSVFGGVESQLGAYAPAAFGGLHPAEDLKLIIGANPRAAVNAMMEGRAEALWYPATSGTMIEAGSHPRGIRVLELDPVKDPEGAKRFAVYKPVTGFDKASDLVVPGARGLWVAVDPAWYCTTEDNMDTEFVYNFVKWLHENHDSYKDAHGMLKNLSVEFVRGKLDTASLPVHSGTIKFLKELGMWSAEDDKRQAYNTQLIRKYENAYKAAIADADQKGIKISPKNSEWIDLWATYKKGFPSLKIMHEIP